MVSLLLSLAACQAPIDTRTPTLPQLTQQPDSLRTKTPSYTSLINTPTPEPVEPKVLAICTQREPKSLFLYGGDSAATQNIFEAIYDGPFDIREYEFQPVILRRKPSLANGDARLDSVEVPWGDLIVDNSGDLTKLEEGVAYRPAGCTDQECVATYSGKEPVTMDSFVVRFKLLPGLKWSDGSNLTADDSLFSYEVAKNLSPINQPNLIQYTQSYQQIDELTVEWSGLPGYQDPLYYTNFFSPLPRHVWENLSPDEMLDQAPGQTPIGWGPYVIDSWIPEGQISLRKNPNYFRSIEGLPHFDALVYRFIQEDEAIDALLSGECDLVDQTLGLEGRLTELLQLEEDGKLSLILQNGTAWEQAAFGIASLNPDRVNIFAMKEVRQAVAMCIDRQKIADELFIGHSIVPDMYTLPTHPLYNAEVEGYNYDPQAAKDLLTAIGWVDLDDDASTPRVAQAIPGIQNGTPFEVEYLTTPDDDRQRSSRIIQDSLAQCGIAVNVNIQDWETMLAAGPEGPVFGRNFDMAQFGWTTSLLPPCFLFLSEEIPGPYPDFPNSWGGLNASGYSSPVFDDHCKTGLSTLPESSDYQRAHYQAQTIFADDLPSIPLYTHPNMVVTRPDMCRVLVDASSKSALWNLEEFDYGENCLNP